LVCLLSFRTLHLQADVEEPAHLLERDLFFATLGKTSARRIVARPNRLTLLPTSENSPTLAVSKSA
jgi:hypothetical protein